MKKQFRILLAVLLVALALLVTGCGKEEPKQAAQAQSKEVLYFNLEKDEYVGAGTDFTSARTPRGDGLYYISFGSQGEKLELICADKALVNMIDMMEIMGLEFDENGQIIGVKTLEECGYQLFSRMLFVTGVEGNVIHTNNSVTGRGVDLDITLTEETEIRDVTGGALLGYQTRDIQVDDELVVLTDNAGTVTHVFVKPVPEIGDVYWNTERMYDSTTAMTTREPDDLGYYTYVFALRGEQVTLRTRDMAVANAIDKQNAPIMTLEFDEEGLITKKTSVKLATGGSSIASWFDIIAINGNTITAERKLSGTRFGEVVEIVLRDDCQIYDCTDFADVEGQVTTLKVGDRIHGETDSRGRGAIIYVVGNRKISGGVIGWNLDRKWDSTNKVSTRQPGADGWYEIEMAIEGKPVTVRTDNKNFVNKIDSFVCYGLKLDENNVVKQVAAAQNIYGGGTYASYYWITKIEGNTITCERDGQTQIIDMADNFICYNVSDQASVKGEVTEPKVGDRVHGFKENGLLRELYVVSRPWDASIYWNINRQYDSTNKTTKRVPDENGFYWFDFAVDGKQITLKTNQKEIADKIDSNSARHVALLHWNGWITKIISTTSITKYSGSTKSISWVDVTKIDGDTIYSQKNQAGHADDGKTFVTTMAKSCKVYNVDSAGVLKYVGEPTTVQVGDRIHAYHNAQGLATLIFIVDNRVAPLDTTPNTCPCEQGVTWEPWDGTTELQDKKYYYLTQDVVAPTEGFVITGQTVNLRLDGHTISSDGRCFWIKSDGKLNICDHGTRGKLIGTGVDGESGGVIRLYTATGTSVNLWNIDVMSDGDNTTMAKEGGIASVSGPFTAHNCNFSGGVSSDKGGNFQVSSGGTFRTFDCTITGGEAENKGGNMNISGRIYMENTTVTGGKTKDNVGSNISFDSTLECVMKDVTITAASGQTNFYMSKGELGVSGKMTITGGTGYNFKPVAGVLADQGLTTDSVIGVTRDGEGTVMTGATEEKLACFTLENFKDQALTFVDGIIQVEERIIIKSHTDHCLCAGNGVEGTSHSCSTETDWTVISDAVFEDAIGTKGTVVGLKFIEDGNYYLSRDYALPSMICIMPGQDITICLNGSELSSSARVAYVAGKLNITDCLGGGVAVGASSSGGGCLKVLNGGDLNIYGGTFQATKTSNSDGGVIVVSTDSGNTVDNTTKLSTYFNMYGGTVSGGKAAKAGGNVVVWHTTCTFNMYGGTIENGSAGTTGSNVHTAGTVNLLGGTISGGDVYHSSGTLTIGNKLKLEALSLKAGKQVKISDKGLMASAPIKLTAPIGVFATNVTTDLSACFQVADGYSITYNATDKTLSLSGQAHKTHCLCSGADLGLADHTCKGISDWQPLTADILVDYVGMKGTVVGKTVPSGNYYLPGDLELSSMLIVPEGYSITIDLCGNDITAVSTRVSYVAGTLTFTDCEGTGTVNGNIAQNGGCIKVLNGGTLNIYGGTFTNPKKDATGGAVVVVSTDSGNVVESSPKKTTTFNLYGGTLTGGSTSGNGGTVATFVSQCVFNMYGGVVENGSADKAGGCMSLNGPSKILGGTVRGGSAGTDGQDIALRSSGSLTLGGNVSIGQIHLVSGKTITIHDSGLTTAAPIVIAAEAGTFATKVTSDLSTCFQALSDTLTVVYDEVEQTLTLQ